MEYWYLVIGCGCLFLLQMALGLIQSQAFSNTFVTLRRMGDKVATGKHKALFSAGAIVLFATTNNGRIIAGKSIRGVTIFARFKPLDAFNGQRLTHLDSELLAKQPPAIRAAIANAQETWIAVHKGKEPVEPPEAFFAFITQVQGKVNAAKAGIKQRLGIAPASSTPTMQGS